MIRRTEVVAIALVGLLIICIIAVLYLAKAFFLPMTMAFIVGTMLSPAASFLERFRIPRALAAVLIVTAAGAGVTFMIGLIASPAMEWSQQASGTRRAAQGEAARVRPAAGALAGTARHARRLRLRSRPFHMPKFDWVQPTLEFLSPTFAEFLLFVATLILFIASWRDLRRALIMTFGDRTARLRTLRMLNEIEEHLGNYLLTVTMINVGVGVITGLICAVTRHAQSGRPRRAGRDAEFHPDHRPGRDVRRAGRGRPGRVPEHRRRTARTAAVRGDDLPGRPFPHARRSSAAGSR